MHSPFNLVVHLLVVAHAIFLLPHHVRLVIRRTRARIKRAPSQYRTAFEYLVAIFLIGIMASPALLYLNASIELATA